ncbi:hypothetical protein WV31_09960 [Magnetospirillum sp. ME-1]|nr:hypothetical protein WV31_09960 [Magnetospirillum sp. ME-1]
MVLHDFVIIIGNRQQRGLQLLNGDGCTRRGASLNLNKNEIEATNSQYVYSASQELCNTIHAKTPTRLVRQGLEGCNGQDVQGLQFLT